MFTPYPACNSAINGCERNIDGESLRSSANVLITTPSGQGFPGLYEKAYIEHTVWKITPVMAVIDISLRLGDSYDFCGLVRVRKRGFTFGPAAFRLRTIIQRFTLHLRSTNIAFPTVPSVGSSIACIKHQASYLPLSTPLMILRCRPAGRQMPVADPHASPIPSHAFPFWYS